MHTKAAARKEKRLADRRPLSSDRRVHGVEDAPANLTSGKRRGSILDESYCGWTKSFSHHKMKPWKALVYW